MSKCETKSGWASTTWDGHRRRQLEDWSKLTLDEILDAQEEMAAVAREIARAPVVRSSPRRGGRSIRRR